MTDGSTDGLGGSLDGRNQSARMIEVVLERGNLSPSAIGSQIFT